LIKGRLQNLDKQDASYVVQQHTKRLRKLAETKQRIGNKMMTGQYQQSTRHALRILKDGDRLLTEPAQIIQKCYTSMTDHHNAPPPQQPAHQYPWELPKAIDKFKLETSAQPDPAHHHGLHKMVTG
jgi:hypothetical protein